MPIKHAIWKVGKEPVRLPPATLPNERTLEDMIIASPSLLSDDWMIIGRQAESFGGRIDLLAIDRGGSLILIELKRDRTPREVVAQALDYASWVEAQKSEDIADIYRNFKPDGELRKDFKAYFDSELDESALNNSHQIVIVAASLDDSTERIVSYLSERGIAINVIFFQVFAYEDEQFISRAWLLDTTPVQTNTSSLPNSKKEPWNGESYASFGLDARNWEDAVQYKFFCAGGGSWYSKTLGLLETGDRIWVNIPKKGYVGVGRVTGPAQPAASFTVFVDGEDVPIMTVAKRASYHQEYIDDEEKCEYFVPIEWLHTVPNEQQAISEVGFFGNQNSICKPTTPKWRHTVERLKSFFPVDK